MGMAEGVCLGAPSLVGAPSMDAQIKLVVSFAVYPTTFTPTSLSPARLSIISVSPFQYLRFGLNNFYSVLSRRGVVRRISVIMDAACY